MRHFVTSFSPLGYTQYGRQFLLGFLEHFPQGEVIHVFHEGSPPDVAHPRLIPHDLYEDLELCEFLQRNKPYPERNGVEKDGTINYRFQATKFARKVFALTSEKLPLGDYRLWIDADVLVKKAMPAAFFDQFCDPAYVAQYLGRSKSWDHSECGFVAYNLAWGDGHTFLAEFRSMYYDHRVFDLSEWHDSYVFDHLRRECEKRGQKFRNIAIEDTFNVWAASPLEEYMKHLKGPAAKAAASPEKIPPVAPAPVAPINIIDLLKTAANRYEQIPLLLGVYKPATLVDVGTCDGARTLEMAQTCLSHKPTVHVTCFDLWEDITPQINLDELNAKRTPDMASVMAKFEAFKTRNPGFSYQLVQGNTRQTLPAHKFDAPVDFAFIDGGHSVETIRSDYNALKAVAKLILMDDWYTAGVDTTVWGCNTVIAGENHAVLPMQDNFSDGKSIQMVLLGAAMSKDGQMPVDGKFPLELKTKNSAPDAEIQAHIRYAASLQRKNIDAVIEKAEQLKKITPVRFIEGVCKPHDDVLVLIGASEELMDRDDPEYQKTWDDLRELARSPRHKLVICKTSYRRCFEEGITPWGCVLLDPRDHVAACIDPNRDVIYFVASMCHASTWDQLTEAGVRVIGYHALVGAGEVDVIKKEYGKVLCVSGGTTSIARGVGLFYNIGFRKMILFGTTGSYKKRLAKPHGRSAKPFIDVTVEGVTFLTDPELVASSVDSELAVKLFPDCEIEYRGAGLIPHAVAIVKKYESEHPGDAGFTDVRVGQFVAAFRQSDLEVEAVNIDKAIVALQERKKFLKPTLESLPEFKDLCSWDQFLQTK